VSTGWFGRMGIAKLAETQKRSNQGISAVTQTCIAAYKQFDDVEYLLKLVEPLRSEDWDGLGKIRERHEKYRLAQANEVIPNG
jgi:hypothetical protein